MCLRPSEHRHIHIHTRDMNRSKQNGILQTQNEYRLLMFNALECFEKQRKIKSLRSTEGDREMDPKVHTRTHKHTLTQMNKSEQWETQLRCNKERRADNIFLAPSYF